MLECTRQHVVPSDAAHSHSFTGRLMEEAWKEEDGIVREETAKINLCPLLQILLSDIILMMFGMTLKHQPSSKNLISRLKP